MSCVILNFSYFQFNGLLLFSEKIQIYDPKGNGDSFSLHSIIQWNDIHVDCVGNSHCGSWTKWRQGYMVSGSFLQEYFQNHFHITLCLHSLPFYSFILLSCLPISFVFFTPPPFSIYFFLLNHTMIELGSTISSSKILHIHMH